MTNLAVSHENRTCKELFVPIQVKHKVESIHSLVALITKPLYNVVYIQRQGKLASQ